MSVCSAGIPALGTALLPWLVSPLVAAQSGSLLNVTTRPARLIRGTIGTILVRPSPGTPKLASLTGRAEGEPLHFRRALGGGFTALIGTGLEGGDSLVVTLLPVRPTGESDSLDLPIVVASARYRREQLRVDPKYVTPDSATQRRIGEELEEARAVGRQSHDTPQVWTRAFRPPRPGRVTSPFGTERTLNGEVQSRHLGTDFAGKVGAPVRAANAGIVALVGDFYLAGTVVYLDHGDGVVTGYFHLSKVTVAAGDTVARGQLIGRVGRSGRVTGPHLHWVARYGRITVDPMSLVRLPARSGHATRQ